MFILVNVYGAMAEDICPPSEKITSKHGPRKTAYVIAIAYLTGESEKMLRILQTKPGRSRQS